MGTQGTAVRTTIEAGVQRAAANAVAGQPAAAAIVAVQASTGHVIAVADHAGGGTRVDPLAGRYQPGGAFTIVSTAALLAKGTALNEPIPCLGSTRVGGRTFTNVPAVSSLGAQPQFSADFAQSCGTAFTTLSQGLTGSRLATAATAFGLGAQWKLPLSAFPGSFQASQTQGGLAADTIGEQGVQTSPLAMALVAAGVDAGKWRPPMLVTSPPDPGLSPRVVADPQTVNSLRSLMRAGGRLRRRPGGQPGRPPGVRAGRDGPGRGRLQVLGALVRGLPGQRGVRRAGADQVPGHVGRPAGHLVPVRPGLTAGARRAGVNASPVAPAAARRRSPPETPPPEACRRPAIP